MDEVIEHLKNLSLEEHDKIKSAIEILKNFQKISSSLEPNSLDNYDVVDLFIKLLNPTLQNDDDGKNSNVEIQKELLKCIAELTKTEAQRKKFTNKNVIEILINFIRKILHEKYTLSSTEAAAAVSSNFDDNSSSDELLIQVCRALGNICYSNDDARNIIVSINGDQHLIELLNINTTKCDDKTTAKNNVELQFIKVRGGLISNYLLGEENLAKRAMSYKIMEKIEHIVDKCCTVLPASSSLLTNEQLIENNEDLLLNTLQLLSILAENVADLNFNSKLNKQLAQILAASKNPDLAEMCLELLHYQAENDDVKLLLAKEGLCETIYRLLEKYQTLASGNSARALMKLACDLIVLILTGDEAMHYLYSTSFLKNMEDWLDSDDIDLLTTGVLALGNFARTDSHCIYMVENKVMNKLLDILSINNGVDDNMRLQHALLSALRNLVIPRPNKKAVIEAGLVQIILPMLEIHQPPVVFKLLGTLRMTVDGQVSLAMELFQNKKLIEQLVNWSKSSEIACVNAESLRLMAWLIKNAFLRKYLLTVKQNNAQNLQSDAQLTSSTTGTSTDEKLEQIESLSSSPVKSDESSLKAFVMIDGAVESMITMLVSQHLVMQNESLIALSILTAVFIKKNSSQTNSPSSSSSTSSSLSSTNNFDLSELYIKCELGKKLAEFIKRSSDNMTKEIVENLKIFTELLRNSDKLINHLEQHNVNELLKSIPILTEYCTL